MMKDKAPQTHFVNDSHCDASIGTSASRPIKSLGLLAALAELQDEFKTILNQNASSPTTDTDTSAAPQ